MSVGHFVALAVFCLIKISAGFNIHNNACDDYNEYFTRFASKGCYYNPDVLTDTPTLIARYGYPLESYKITTDDGYILTLFRIPPNGNSKKQPVFLMHGILLNNSIWVFRGNLSLAFRLSDEGYDVWLGTIRGTKFSKAHTRYTITSKEYWNFNLDSLAYFDVGAQLKFIKNKTKSRVAYIGYSMGSTLGFLYSAGYPSEVRNLLSKLIALAPVLYLNDTQLVERFREILGPLERQFDRLHINGLFYQEHLNPTAVKFCSTSPFFCKKLIEMFAGNVTEQFRPDDLLLFFSQMPSGTAVQVIKHYFQIAESDYVRRYDYGKLKNLRFYYLTEPRKYQLDFIRLPVYLLYGKNDILVSEKGIKTLYGKLGSSKKRILSIPRKENSIPFNHVDFIMAKDIEEYVYAEVLQILKEE